MNTGGFFNRYFMFNLLVESQPDGDLLQLYTSIMAWYGRTRLINGTKNDPTAHPGVNCFLIPKLIDLIRIKFN